MKKLAAMIMTIAVCAAMLASCGANSKDTAEVKTTTTTAAQTTAEPTTAAQTTTAPTTTAAQTTTTTAATAKATAAKATAKATQRATAKPAAKPAKTQAAKKNEKSTPKPTAKKNKAKATQKATQKAAAKKGLTKADYEWALQKGIEYIKSLPKANLVGNASGYTAEASYPPTYAKTRDVLWKFIKEEVYGEYVSSVNSNPDLEKIDMSLSLKNDGNEYFYTVRYDMW